MANDMKLNIGPDADLELAAVAIDESKLLSLNATGYARHLTVGDVFAGFAVESIDNSTGSAGDKFIRARRGRFRITATVSGSSLDAAMRKVAVYATDHETLTLDGGTHIGSLIQHRKDGTSLILVDTEAGAGQGSGEFVITQDIALADFTDAGGATGYVDLDAGIPGGTVVDVVQVEIKTVTGGDTKTLDVGVDGDADAFVAGIDAESAATLGAKATLATSYVAADDTIRVTLTEGDDFGDITAFTAEVRLLCRGGLQI